MLNCIERIKGSLKTHEYKIYRAICRILFFTYQIKKDGNFYFSTEKFKNIIFLKKKIFLKSQKLSFKNFYFSNGNRILFKHRKKLKIHRLKKIEISIFRGQKSLEIGFSVLFENYQWESTVADWNHRQTGLVDCISLENRNTTQPSDATQSSNRKSLFEDIGANIRLRLIDSQIIEFQRQFVRGIHLAKFISIYNISKKKKLIYFSIYFFFQRFKYKRKKQKF